MAAIRSRDTKPELSLRAALRSVGATGYRIHRKDIPGKPDIAYTRWKVAVFVDGVFWHGHPDHWDSRRAPSDYWRQKIQRNIDRDTATNAELRRRGWKVVRIWDKEIESHIEDSIAQVTRALREAGWRDSTTPGRDSCADQGM
jgi:DNA mismatch endonuclease (patch repair protein)